MIAPEQPDGLRQLRAVSRRGQARAASAVDVGSRSPSGSAAACFLVPLLASSDAEPSSMAIAFAPAAVSLSA